MPVVDDPFHFGQIAATNSSSGSASRVFSPVNRLVLMHR